MKIQTAKIDPQKLRAKRKSRLMTATGVAKAVGVSRQSFCQYEKGKAQPPLDVLVRLCCFFRCQFTDLIDCGSGFDLNEIEAAIGKLHQLTADDPESMSALISRIQGDHMVDIQLRPSSAFLRHLHTLNRSAGETSSIA